MTAMAPAISNHRRYRLPCLEIPPSRSLPPVECCLGTSPIQAARLRPDENSFQSPTSATRAVATIGPTPGFPPVADFLHTIGARRECASRSLQSLLRLLHIGEP